MFCQLSGRLGRVGRGGSPGRLSPGERFPGSVVGRSGQLPMPGRLGREFSTKPGKVVGRSGIDGGLVLPGFAGRVVGLPGTETSGFIPMKSPILGLVDGRVVGRLGIEGLVAGLVVISGFVEGRMVGMAGLVVGIVGRVVGRVVGTVGRVMLGRLLSMDGRVVGRVTGMLGRVAGRVTGVLGRGAGFVWGKREPTWMGFEEVGGRLNVGFETEGRETVGGR